MLERSPPRGLTEHHGPDGSNQNGNKTARHALAWGVWERSPPASPTAGREHVQRLLQVPLEHLSAEEGHRDIEEPALALPASVQDHPDVTAGVLRGSTVNVHVPPGCHTFESCVVPTTLLSDHSYRSRAHTAGLPSVASAQFGPLSCNCQNSREMFGHHSGLRSVKSVAASIIRSGETSVSTSTTT